MKWGRGKRKEKIIILGGRSGTSLVHKCLLITGLINWGLWSLEHYESEAPIKLHIWNNYPNISEEVLKPKYYWEIAKSPDFGFVIDKLINLYDIKFIILERPLREQVRSHIKAWGDGFMKIYNAMPNFQNMLLYEFGFIPDDIETVLTLYMAMRYRLQEEALRDYPKEKILRINYHNLMDEYWWEMAKICKFLDINYDIYQNLFKEMRKIKHMETGTDIKFYLRL